MIYRLSKDSLLFLGQHLSMEIFVSKFWEYIDKLVSE